MLTLEKFEAGLTPEKLTQLQVIYRALAVSVSLFAALIVMLMQQDVSIYSGSDTPTVLLLTVIAPVWIGAAYTAGRLIFNFQTEKLKTAVSPEDAVKTLVTAYIVRAALAESAALFGLVACFLAASDGTMQKNPLLFVNFAGAVLFLGFLALTFPTKDLLIDVFKTKSGN